MKITALLSKILKIPGLVILKLRLRAAGVIYGNRLRGKNVIIQNKGSIQLGNNVLLRSNPAGNPYRTALFTNCPEAKIIIGNKCVLNGTTIHSRSSVTIEDYCLFAPGVQLIDNDSHRISLNIHERRLPPKAAAIVIRKNAWIGLNSIILKGVEIGQNSIIAANSVVTKSIPKNTLAGGNPAKIIRELD